MTAAGALRFVEVLLVQSSAYMVIKLSLIAITWVFTNVLPSDASAC
jgi:hypothetical protein